MSGGWGDLSRDGRRQHADHRYGGAVARKQANLARVLAGVGIEPLDQDDGKRIGELLRRAGSADVVGAHVALLVAPADVVLTSDLDDIRALLRARGFPAYVQRI